MAEEIEGPTLLEHYLEQKKSLGREIVNVDEPQQKLVIFTLGNERYAFPGKQIREILIQQPLFFVPGTPPALEGVINLRNAIVSVLRLDLLLNLPQGEDLSDKPTVIIGEGGAFYSGIRVDRVLDVMDVPQSFIHPPPSTLPPKILEVASGGLLLQKESIVIIDLDRLFQKYLQQS
ncbi:MAG: chemotaxis protein CheW [Gammaproteobacteria bacterium]|nr:chemotaxis protein CheW [Gammaproteobacteria bacterium]